MRNETLDSIKVEAGNFLTNQVAAGSLRKILL
jgi:hypothetical protein